jgi:hypothetical protein
LVPVFVLALMPACADGNGDDGASTSGGSQPPTAQPAGGVHIWRAGAVIRAALGRPEFS